MNYFIISDIKVEKTTNKINLMQESLPKLKGTSVANILA